MLFARLPVPNILLFAIVVITGTLSKTCLPTHFDIFQAAMHTDSWFNALVFFSIGGLFERYSHGGGVAVPTKTKQQNHINNCISVYHWHQPMNQYANKTAVSFLCCLQTRALWKKTSCHAKPLLQSTQLKNRWTNSNTLNDTNMQIFNYLLVFNWISNAR